jgi:methyl-accepting chemotaxis protein
MLRLNSLSIGIKLAIMSGLGILLMAGMIAILMLGNASVRNAIDETNRQQTITMTASDTRSATRGMQIGLRDMRLALSLNDSKKAMDNFHDRLKAASRFIDTLVQSIKSEENLQRITKVKALNEQYVAEIEKIAKMNEEIFSLQAQRMGATTTEARDLSERIGDLDSEANRTMREVALPMANEIEKLVGDLVTASRERSAQQVAALTQTMSSTEEIALGVGLAAILTLIGSAAYGAFAIAKPMHKMADVLTALTKNYNI